MLKQFPFASEADLIDTASDIWYNKCSTIDWLESFKYHPKIGDVKSLTKKFAGKEQASVAVASKKTITALAKANKEYEAKFGFIFILFATGKSATEMLRLLEDRLSNTIGEELHIAMGEQMKITILRFQKLITDGNWGFLKPGHLTTHVLNTAIGKPGKDISIRLQIPVNAVWQTIAQGITNADGRIADLLPTQKKLAHGNYKLVFDTGNYFASQKIKGFYPEVEIQFIVFDDAHYHVPLLINPFGYSTYRGS
jgi:5-hydroxyisourate hydrolase/2-oxo-4-hydroxy-4-carboxy-5-ureidoimidazoline decarboxylase